jgi:hypothetical protein
MDPHPSHLDETDPAKAGITDIREEADRELEHYASDLHDLVLLIPEERWDEFVRATGGADTGGQTSYRGVTFRPGPVTAVVAQEGF